MYSTCLWYGLACNEIEFWLVNPLIVPNTNRGEDVAFDLAQNDGKNSTSVTTETGFVSSGLLFWESLTPRENLASRMILETPNVAEIPELELPNSPANWDSRYLFTLVKRFSIISEHD